MAADAAALLVARQVVAIHRRGDGRNRGDQLRCDLGRQKIPQIQERALAGELAAQGFNVHAAQARVHRLIGIQHYRATRDALRRSTRRYSITTQTAKSGAPSAAATRNGMTAL